METAVPRPKPLPTQQVLRSLLRYDPTTGELFWRERPRGLFKTSRAWKTWNKRYGGKPAFTTSDSNGYREGRINREGYYAHRVIWKLVTGEEPPEIDHQDGNPGNNRFRNLCASDRERNSKNTSLRVNNTSGVQGVGWYRAGDCWKASIMVSGKLNHLGYFDQFEDAVRARQVAERNFGFHPNHGRPTCTTT